METTQMLPTINAGGIYKAYFTYLQKDFTEMYGNSMQTTNKSTVFFFKISDDKANDAQPEQKDAAQAVCYEHQGNYLVRCETYHISISMFVHVEMKFFIQWAKIAGVLTLENFNKVKACEACDSTDVKQIGPGEFVCVRHEGAGFVKMEAFTCSFAHASILRVKVTSPLFCGDKLF